MIIIARSYIIYLYYLMMNFQDKCNSFSKNNSQGFFQFRYFLGLLFSCNRFFPNLSPSILAKSVFFG